MDKNMIILAAQLVVFLIFYLANRYIFQNLTSDQISDITSKFNIIVNYAEAFVVWARQFMNGQSGEAKMNTVTGKLKEIATRYEIDMTEDEIKAIVQKAYEGMIASEKTDN